MTEYILTSGLWIVAVIVALTIHEWAHAYAAYRLGDDTAYSQGRMTLNPLSHIDPIGFISLVILHFGWGKPVPISTMHLRKGRLGISIVSLAGPFSNFILAMILMVIVRLVEFGGIDTLSMSATNLGAILLWKVILINIWLGAFNLIPIPPLDGSKVAMELIGLSEYQKMQLERTGPLLLIGFIVFDIASNQGILLGLLRWSYELLLGLFGFI